MSMNKSSEFLGCLYITQEGGIEQNKNYSGSMNNLLSGTEINFKRFQPD